MTSPTPVIKYVRSDDTYSIVVTDLTGAFSTTNLTGYGGPNADVSDFTAFNISITLPDPDTLLPSGTPVVVNAYNTLPSNADGTFTLTSLAVLGTADTAFIDGVYLFEVSAPWANGLDSGTATASNNKAFYEIVGCCIRNMVAESADCGCSGSSKKIQTLTQAWMNLGILEPYVFNNTIVASTIEQIGAWDTAAEIISTLQDICDNENCGGCNGCN